MITFKAALAYEAKKTARNFVLFIVGVVAFVAAVNLIANAIGYPGMGFNGLYSWSFLFLGFATIIAFNGDWSFFLQSGLTRSQAFGVFATTCAFASVAFALLDGVLSVAFPAYWSAQSLALLQFGSYSADAFFYVLAVNLAVSLSVLAGTVLHKRAGMLGVVVACVALMAVFNVGLPALTALFSGSAVPLAGLYETVASSPYAREAQVAQAIALNLAAAAAAAAVGWALMRRAEVR